MMLPLLALAAVLLLWPAPPAAADGARLSAFTLQASSGETTTLSPGGRTRLVVQYRGDW